MIDRGLGPLSGAVAPGGTWWERRFAESSKAGLPVRLNAAGRRGCRHGLGGGCVSWGDSILVVGILLRLLGVRRRALVALLPVLIEHLLLEAQLELVQLEVEQLRRALHLAQRAAAAAVGQRVAAGARVERVRGDGRSPARVGLRRGGRDGSGKKSETLCGSERRWLALYGASWSVKRKQRIRF